MIMFKKLPYFVYLKGKKYTINVDFRNMISFEEIVQDKMMDKFDKIKYGIQHFYPAFFEDRYFYMLIQNKELYKEACDKLVWFYKCGREDYLQNKSTNKSVPINQVFSYEYDDELIYAAFYQEYNIDLAYDRVHWWKFKALLKGLKADVTFEKIKGYRAYQGKDKELLELKEYYKLPRTESEQKRLDAIFESFK